MIPVGKIEFAPDYRSPMAFSPFGRTPLAPRRVPDNDNARPRVVALSGAAGSGKSTVADYLVRNGFTRVKFAAPLKAMCSAIGLTDAHIEGELKEQPCALLQGKTPRYAMQTLGTEWGRALLGDDFWVGLWRQAANDVLESGGSVVVDDCRFPNEAAVVRKMGGDIIRLSGRGGISGGHSSERLDFVPDAVIENDGSIDDLYVEVEKVLARWC